MDECVLIHASNFSSFYECFVSEGVVMSASRQILESVVLVNLSLFSLSDVFPVGHVFDI